MASGTSITIDASRCDAFGLNPYPSAGTTNPSHGTVSVDAAAGKITYTNDGDGATSDSFMVADASANLFTVNVAIGAATSPITVSPASLPTPHVGVSYSQTLSATGGTAPYSYAMTGGALPPGLTLSGATISGISNQAGSYTATITVTDNVGTTGTKSYTVIVPNPSSGIAVAAPPTAFLNVPYSQTLSASGALAPYTFALNSGSLPPGIALASNGTLSGTPTSTGTYNFNVVVTDSSPNLGGTSPGPYFKVVSLSLTVQNLPPPVANPVSATVAYGSTNNPITLNITGGTPASVAVGTQATYGTAIASGTSITYTPTAGYAGPDSFTYTATNSGGTSSPATATITVSPPTITYAPSSPAAGTVGTAYSQSVAGASGGAAPYTYTIVSGSLPAGITLAANGTLSGTPTANSTFNFTVKATDSSTGTGPFNKTSGTLTLTIAAPTINYAPTNPLPATVGTAYSRSLASATGGTAPYTYTIAAGSLPAGITLASNGTLSGTPTAGGTFNFTVTATDSSGGTGPFSATSGALTLTVNAPTVVVSPTTLPNPTAATAYSQNVTASGGTAAYTFAITAGSLPSGLSMSSAGAITGTPTAAGAFNFTITATDSSTGTGPYTGSRAYTLTVGAPTLTLTPASGATINGTAGLPVSATFSAGNGTAPYTYAVTAGALPPGVTLASTGTLSGSPTAAGNFNFTVTATDSSTGTSAPFTVSGSYTLAIVAPTITLSPTTLPVPAVGSAYSQTITASEGHLMTFTYNVTSGLLPTGLNLDVNTGVLSGTPTAAGPFNFTITATDSGGFTGSQAYSLSVGAGTVILPPSTLANTAAETPYTHTFAASGGTAPYSYSLTAGALPPGLALSSAGTLSGTPTAAGTFNFTLRAADSSTGPGAPFSASQAYSLTVTAPTITVAPATLPASTGGVAYSQTITASGGNGGYTYSLASGALPPGIVLSSAGSLSGTPTAAGSYNFTVTATDGFGFTGSQAYTFDVNAPTIVITPATLPGGQVAVAYSQALTASGGNGGYTYSLASGALPPGVVLSSAGSLAGSPTTAGNYNFTVKATDGFGFSGSQAYMLGINQPVPVTVNDTATTPANSPVTIAVTTNDTGPITSIAVAQAPAHGTATVNGLNVVYTPATNFFGNDAFTYTATGPGGTSTPATVSVTVAPLAVPVAAAQSVTVLAGESVTIHAATGASTGPFTAATVVNAPTSGTATVQGTDIVYAADANASGTFGFDYSLSNAFGASQLAHVTVTVNPRPVAPALTAATTAGTTVKVDLTAKAHGGPFTDAKVVSVSPANAGSATIVSTGDGSYTLAFTSAATFGGVAQITYTLSNAFATSAPGTLDVTVKLRSDPSKNAEVLGVLEAQVEAARRMAMGQIGNFQRRLESLHGGGSRAGFTNGITMNSASSQRRTDTLLGMQQRVMGGGGDPFLVPADVPATDRAASGGNAPDGVAFWSGGAMNFGKLKPGTSHDGIDFTTSGLSLGADKQVTQALTLGLGAGYGHDASDIGQHGSRSAVDSYNVAAYGSYQPGESAYMDALVGYQWLQFDARRFVTDNGNTVRGSRDGKQWFASISVGYRHQADDMLLTLYGRLDVARATLDGYTETGDAIFALSYQEQTVKTSTGTVGLLAQWTVKRDYGVWAPQLRAEFGHDMQGSSQATMRYADLLSGPLYQATLARQSRNHTLLGAGIALQTLKGWSLRAEYQNQLDNTSRDNQSILFSVQKTLPP
jgi:uncharacterized protein YhjY with autotransporter beta-barrel domain